MTTTHLETFSDNPTTRDRGPWLLACWAWVGNIVFRSQWQWFWGIEAVDAIVLILILGVVRWQNRGGLPTSSPRLQEFWPVVAAGLAPLMTQSAFQYLAGIGDAREVVALVMMQNAAVVLAWFHNRFSWGNLSLGLSGLQIVFISCSAISPWLYPVAIGFLTLLLMCLSQRYWARMNATGTRPHGQRRLRTHHWRIPAVTTLGVVCLVAAAGTVVSKWDRLAAWAFMASSGRGERGDRWARQGFGQSDELQAAVEQAEVTGAVDSDIFLSTDKPTLYDALDELLGHAHVEQTKKIAIQNRNKTGQEQGRSSKTAGHKSTVNWDSATSQPLNAETSTALFLVRYASRPRLRWLCFQENSAGVWLPSEQASAPTPAGTTGWFTSPHLLAKDKNYVRNEQWELQILNWRSDVIPTPVGGQAWMIPDVGELSFFGWSPHSVATTLGARLPEHTLVYWDVCLTDDDRAAASEFPGTPRQSRALISETLGELAWETERSWDQLLRIEAFFRQHYSCVSASVDVAPDHVAAETTKIVASDNVWKLTNETPEHWQLVPPANLERVFSVNSASQTATGGSASSLSIAAEVTRFLQDLGYRSRLVLGCAPGSEAWDRSAQGWVIRREHVHAWVEVQTATGEWLPLEPNAAHPLPVRVRSWWRWAYLVLLHVGEFARQHAWAMLSAMGLLACLWMLRQQLVIRSLAMLWRWSRLLPGLGRGRLPVWVWRVRWWTALLQWLGWWGGKPRLRHQSIRQWLQENRQHFSGPSAGDWYTLLSLVERAHYSQLNSNRELPPQWEETAERVLRSWRPAKERSRKQ